MEIEEKASYHSLSILVYNVTDYGFLYGVSALQEGVKLSRSVHIRGYALHSRSSTPQQK
jgi:hypothetical protein